MFAHKPLELPELTRSTLPSGRTYNTPEGNSYPSITTLLGKTSDKSFLIAWRKRIGAEKAQQITTKAANRGTAMHALCEDYVNNDELREVKNPMGDMLFKIMKPALDRIDNVRAQESFLYSDKLRVAGQVDCIADFDGKLTTIDYKSSSKLKREDWISDYFLQTCFYSYALYEMTGLVVEQVAILIACETGDLQIFTLDKKEIMQWTGGLVERIGEYYDQTK